MLQQILLSITFVYGIIALLMFTKLFDKYIIGFISSLSPFKDNKLVKYIDILFFIFSLCYQSWYWLFKNV